MAEPTVEKVVKAEKSAKIDPEQQQFQEVPARLRALEAAVAELQLRLSVDTLTQLLSHHHQMRPNMLNYVDKPVLIKDRSFIPINDGSDPRP